MVRKAGPLMAAVPGAEQYGSKAALLEDEYAEFVKDPYGYSYRDSAGSQKPGSPSDTQHPAVVPD